MERYLKRGIAIVLTIVALILLSSNWLSLIGSVQEEWESTMNEISAGMSTIDLLTDVKIPTEVKEGVTEIVDVFSDGNLSPKEEFTIATSLKKMEKKITSLVEIVESFDASIETAKAKDIVKQIMNYAGIFKLIYSLTFVLGIATIIACIIFNKNIIQLFFALFYGIIAAVNLVANSKINHLPGEMETKFTGGLVFGILVVLLITILTWKNNALFAIGKNNRTIVDTEGYTIKGVKDRSVKAANAAQTAAHSIASNAQAAINSSQTYRKRDVTWLCIACGAQNEDNNKFCGQCGAKRPEIPHEARIIIDNLEIEKDQLNKQLEELTLLNNGLIEENSELKAKISNVERASQNEGYKDKCELLNKEIQERQSKNKVLELANQKLVAMNEQLTFENNILKEQINKTDLQKTKFCRHCGAKIPAESVVCPDCGKNLK